MRHTAVVICADAKGQNTFRNVWRIMSWPWSWFCYNFFFFQRMWKIFVKSNQSEAASSWKLRSICTHCCNLEHFLSCTTLNLFSKEAADVFAYFYVISFRMRYYFAHHGLFAFVCQTNGNCVLVAFLFTHDWEQRCRCSVGLGLHVTAYSTWQNFLRFPVARIYCLLA